MTSAERKELALRLFGTGKPGAIAPIDPGWVTATLLKGNRMTLKRWRESGIPADRVDEVIEAIVAILPETQKGAAPSVLTRRLLAGVIALETRAKISPDELATAQESAAAIEAGMEQDARLAAELEASRRKSVGRAPGQAGGRADVSPGSKRRRQ